MNDILTLLDPVTGLLDRQGWQRFALGEEERCRRHGNVATVIVVRLEAEPSHNTLVAAAAAARAGSRLHDLVARVSENELAVLATECPPDEAEAVAERLSARLSEARVTHWIGVAGRHTSRDVLAALDEAGARAGEAAEDLSTLA